MNKSRAGHDAIQFEYDYIDEGIYIGTNQCCVTHFSNELLEKGVTADISLEKKKIDHPFGVEFYLWLPVEDHTAPTQAQFVAGVDMLEIFIQKLKRTVYVHCEHGHGRAPTLVAAYFMKTRGMTIEETEALIKKHRPTIHIEDSQKEALKKFKNSL